MPKVGPKFIRFRTRRFEHDDAAGLTFEAAVLLLLPALHPAIHLFHHPEYHAYQRPATQRPHRDSSPAARIALQRVRLRLGFSALQEQ